MLRHRLPLVVLLPASLLLAGCAAVNQYDYDVDVTYELYEDDPAIVAARGQRTCLAEAQARGSTSTCPREDSGGVYPAKGVRVLDAAYVAPAGPSNPKDGPQNGDAVKGLNHLGYDVFRGTNTERASGGLLPATITPGPGQFIAFLGYWDNLNFDDAVQAVAIWGPGPDPANEWKIVPDAPIYGYIEPGSHPAFQSFFRPESTTPDVAFRYVVQSNPSGGGIYVTDQGRYVLFLDGSLFTTLEVVVVSDPILAPSPTGRPYTERAGSRVDVDRYVAQAPAPIADVYAATAGPLATEIGSPAYGTCPNACSVEPVRAPGSPLEATLGSTQGQVWAPYEREWREAGDSTAAGRHHVHLERYAGWIDLLPRYGYSGALSEYYDMLVAPPGVGANGRQAFPPGYFSADIWVGLWHDFTGEGAVGVARHGDVYEGGNRPLPDDYYNSRGEFIGVTPNGLDADKRFTVTLVPETDWGPLGVYGTILGAPYPSIAPDPACVGLLLPTGNCVRIGGSAPITAAVALSDGPGHYRFTSPLFFPAGSVPFRVCTPTLGVVFDEAGVSVEEPVRDCDSIDGFEAA